jgi:tetratricopeptide (TPR) repeat protein
VENEKKEIESLLQKAAFRGLSEEGHEDAIAILDQVIKKYGGRKEIEIEQLVAEAHISKGFMLGNWFFLIGPNEKSPKEAFAKYIQSQKTFDEVVTKFGNREEAKLAIKVANAFWYKGHVLEKAKQFKDAFLNYEQVVKRYGDRKEFELSKITASALCDMGNILLESNNLEGAFEIFENVIRHFGKQKEPDFAESLAEAFYGRGIIFRKSNRHQDALKTFEELISKYAFSDRGFRVGPVAKAFLGKGLSQCELGHFEAAIKTFDEIIEKYGSGKTAPIFEDLVTQARENKRALTLKAKGSEKGIIPRIFDFFSKSQKKENKNHEESPVIREFGNEVSKWPSDQARMGLQMFQKLMEGEVDDIEERFPNIQFGYFKIVMDTFKKYVKEIEGNK